MNHSVKISEKTYKRIKRLAKKEKRTIKTMIDITVGYYREMKI